MIKNITILALILRILFTFEFGGAIVASEWVVFPTRTFQSIETRGSRSSGNIILDTNNEISDLKPEKKAFTVSYEPASVNNTPEIDLISNTNWIYSGSPATIAPIIYKPNYNQEMANYLKNTFPMIVHGQLAKPNYPIDTQDTTPSNHLMKGLRSVQDSVFSLVQKVKDFCTYVWKFFVDDNSIQSVEGRGKKKFKIRKKYKKFLLPLLLAYKLKFFLMVPLLISGLVLLTGTTGMAGFFFALFTAVLTLKHGGGGGKKA